MKLRAVTTLNLIMVSALLSGCAPATFHKYQVRDTLKEKVTIGKVQKEIKIGMPSAKVVEILGPPNLITTDEQRREVWVYDKIATEVVYSESDAGLKFLTPGSAGALSSTQRTLTIIIKFDKEGKVRDFAYHASRF